MAVTEREKPRPAVDPSPKSVPAGGVTTAEGLKATPAPVNDPLQAGHPTANIPDRPGLEGAPLTGVGIAAQAAALYQLVDYTVPDGDAPDLAALRSGGLKAGDSRVAFVTKRHDDGAVDLLVAGEGGGYAVPRVWPSDAAAGAERSRGKWSPHRA